MKILKLKKIKQLINVFKDTLEFTGVPDKDSLIMVVTIILLIVWIVLSLFIHLIDYKTRTNKLWEMLSS